MHFLQKPPIASPSLLSPSSDSRHSYLPQPLHFVLAIPLRRHSSRKAEKMTNSSLTVLLYPHSRIEIAMSTHKTFNIIMPRRFTNLKKQRAQDNPSIKTSYSSRWKIQYRLLLHARQIVNKQSRIQLLLWLDFPAPIRHPELALIWSLLSQDIPIDVGVCLTLIHLISIPVTNNSINPARSTAVVLYLGGWATEQLWLFWVAPLGGAVLGTGVYKASHN